MIKKIRNLNQQREIRLSLKNLIKKVILNKAVKNGNRKLKKKSKNSQSNKLNNKKKDSIKKIKIWIEFIKKLKILQKYL